MFQYRYIIKKADGTIQGGDLYAISQSAAEAELQAAGYTIDSIWLADEESQQPNRKLSAEQSQVVAGQIAQIVEQELPLEASLRAMSSEAETYYMRSALRRLSNQLATGADPAELIEHTNTSLPPHFRNILLTGLKTNQLGPLLREYSRIEQARLSRSRKVWLAMIYPVILLTSAFTLILFLVSTVIPKFRNIFEDFGTELPGLTILIISASQLLQRIGLGLISIILVLVFIYVLQRILLSPAHQFRISKLLSVIFGIDQTVAISNYFHILAIFVEKQLPLPVAVPLAADCVGDNSTIQKMLPALEGHVNAAQARSTLEGLEPRLQSVFRWKDNQEAFTSMLRANADSLALQTDMRLTRILMLIEPVMYFLILGACGFVVFGLFLPLIKLLNDLS